jgi:hypothetical protein
VDLLGNVAYSMSIIIVTTLELYRTSKIIFVLLLDSQNHQLRYTIYGLAISTVMTPLWETEGNERLFTSENINAADILIDALADYGMDLALPPGILTLEHFVTKNLHRVDQVFCSGDHLPHIDQCCTMPERRPPKTDHFPIATMARNEEVPGFNFRKTDWQDFHDYLSDKLGALHLRDPEDTADFERMLDESENDIDPTHHPRCLSRT